VGNVEVSVKVNNSQGNEIKDKFNINVVDGSAGVAAYDAGTKIDLTGSTLKYKGEGYAAYSDGNGQIILNNADIELRGKATLMNIDWSVPAANRPIKTSATNVTVFSNDVVGINLKKDKPRRRGLEQENYFFFLPFAAATASFSCLPTLNFTTLVAGDL